MNKVIYVVYGSEDGLLGCFGNVKAAYKCASGYVSGFGRPGPNLSYAKVCSELRDTINYPVGVNEGDYERDIDATITACFFNKEVYL